MLLFIFFMTRHLFWMQAESALIPTFGFELLILLLSRFFQIRDDYMNLQSSGYSGQKGFCEDLDAGKFSYLIVHCLQHRPESRAHILGIVRQRPSALGQGVSPLSRETKLHILELLKTAGTFASVRNCLDEMETEIDAGIEKL
jgi:ophiobolin F synthase